MIKRMSVAMAGAAMLVLIAACGADNPTPTSTPAMTVVAPRPTPTPTPTPTASAPGSPQAALLQAQERWEHSGVADYAYTGAWVCFCPEVYLADTQVTVSGGSVTAVGPADPGIGTIPAPERFVPIDDLFTLIQDAITNDAARIEVSYNETYGYPTSLFIDHDERMADEETSFAISSFTPR